MAVTVDERTRSISSSESSNGVPNGVGFEPPRPANVILPSERREP